MFTRNELLADLRRLSESPSPRLEKVEFDQCAFDSLSSEESIYAIRGFKRDFPIATLFWVKSLQSQDWEGRAEYFDRYAELGQCSPLTEHEFFELISTYSDRLRKDLPAFVKPRPGFVKAMKMHSDWDDVAAIAEFADEFVAFCWNTTA
jgi:hypothetical protein